MTEKVQAQPLTLPASLPTWLVLVLALGLGGASSIGGATITGGAAASEIATELRDHEVAPGHAVSMTKIAECESKIAAMDQKLDGIQKNQLIICAKLGAECQ